MQENYRRLVKYTIKECISSSKGESVVLFYYIELSCDWASQKFLEFGEIFWQEINVFVIDNGLILSDMSAFYLFWSVMKKYLVFFLSTYFNDFPEFFQGFRGHTQTKLGQVLPYIFLYCSKLNHFYPDLILMFDISGAHDLLIVFF